MKSNRWKRKTKPRTPVRLFVEQLEVRTMPTGLTVFGTDGAKHETAAKEESFGTFTQGVNFNEGITVKKKTPDLLMIVSFVSPDGRYDDIYLSNFATIYIKDELLRVPGVSDGSICSKTALASRIFCSVSK